ncbi:MAG TPA: CBS domain-containing protein [Candidatus Bathyarchaeia archaeon]|nr:CBS domain-containing protein [Candidatus Bathyarchaeia archaeon]
MQAVSQKDTVNSIMTGWVVSIPQSDTLLQARDIMSQRGVSQLVVVDEKMRPVGMISKRDLARFLMEDSTNRTLEEISVSEASSKSMPEIREDLPVFNAARLFDTENLTCAIVTNEHPFIGIVTETDLCNYFSRRVPNTFKVSDFMARDFIFAKGSYPVVHVAQAIVFKQSSVPVIDDELIGILTLSDLLSIGQKKPDSIRHHLVFNSESIKVAMLTTRDLMTRDPVSAKQDDDLAQAAQTIVRKGIGSMPVIDNEGTVVGLLSKHDIVRALGRVGKPLDLE